MPTTKPSKKTKPAQNKSAFVRSLPRAMPAKEVVAKAKAAGLTLSEKYVSTIRYNAKVSKRKKAAKSNGALVAAPAPVKRGPGRPRTIAAGGGEVGNGLVGEIETMIASIFEKKIAEVFSRQ